MPKRLYYQGILMIFKNDVFSKGGPGGGFALMKKRWFSRLGGPWGLPRRGVFAPCGPLGASSEGCFLALGARGGSRHHRHVFFGARGVPLERPRHASLQIMMVKPVVF